MQVDCTHCGRPNQALDGTAPGATVVCAVCGRPFTVDVDLNGQLGRVPIKRVPAGDAGFGSLGQPGGLGSLGDLGPPAPGPDFGSLGAPGGSSSSSLGDMPTTEGDAFDLSSILSPTPRAPAQPLVAPPPEFQFGGTMDKFNALNLDTQPGDPESTRVVDVDAEVALRQMSTPTTDRPPPETASGWRVRSERGLVYELMTVDAVVAWLEGKADISGVRVARAQGLFQGVESFPEIAKRLGMRPGGVVEAPKLAAGGAGELSLAMERAPSPRSRQKQAAAADGPNQKKGQRDRPDAKAKEARSVERPVGMGAVLGMLVGTLALAGAAVFAGVKTEALALPPPLAATAEAPVPAPGPELAEAIKAYEAGHFTAATTRLKSLTKKGDDPRAWRYLALALHKSNRDPEAQKALDEYRRRKQQAGGDGRQVREVQH